MQINREREGGREGERVEGGREVGILQRSVNFSLPTVVSTDISHGLYVKSSVSFQQWEHHLDKHSLYVSVPVYLLKNVNDQRKSFLK